MMSSPPILVTGASGFVGSHMLDLLQREGTPVVAWHRPHGPDLGPQKASPAATRDDVRWQGIDLTDRRAVHEAIAELRPAAVYHLAGAAHEGRSWDATADTLAINVLGTHYLFEALRAARLRARVLIPGSALVYRQSTEAIGEDHDIGPASPYAVSKLAQEMLGVRAVAEDGAEVMLSRSFNHVGPRQDPSFSASGFARQIAAIEAGRAEAVVSVGNLDTRRDLTDVRDTVRAYRLMIARGTPGRVYNVCSGRAYLVRELLDRLVAEARVKVEVRTDSSRLRPSDSPLLLGDPRRISAELGWSPEIPIDRTLRDLLDYWRARMRNPECEART